MKAETMNKNSPTAFYAWPALFLVVALLLGAGCRSTGYRKSDAAGKSLSTAAAEVQAESRAIDATVAALNDLVNQPATDLKPQFRRFSAALKRLVAAAEQTEKRGEFMEEKNAEYFAVWDQEVAAINYGIVREQSENRRAEVTNRFHSIKSRYEEAQAVVRPLINYFSDIQTALSLDLTSDGLESVRSIVNNADQNSRKVQMALGRLAEELTASSTSMSSFALRKPQPQPEESRIQVRDEASTNRPPPNEP
ncbi:MAG TPA: DUF2959 family protein [Methylomirabilota bacterium]|nr:DUF2959 family protein [Methylomirabilota bacterium]